MSDEIKVDDVTCTCGHLDSYHEWARCIGSTAHAGVAMQGEQHRCECETPAVDLRATQQKEDK